MIEVYLYAPFVFRPGKTKRSTEEDYNKIHMSYARKLFISSLLMSKKNKL